MGERSSGLGLVGLVLIVLIGAALARAYLEYGRPNQDEGWYLEAARQVRAGQRPYLDFAYVQPPLLPYSYALLGADDSLWRGRLVTAGFGLLAVLCCGLAARRGGDAAMLTAAGLLAFTPFALAQHGVVKAYALANACCALALWAAGDGTSRRRVALAGLAVALAALARNSSAPLAVAFGLWLLAPARRRCFVAGMIAVSAPLVAAYAPLLAADADAVRFHLIEHHARNTAGGDLARLVLTMVVVGRLMVAACPALSIALFGGLLAQACGRGERTETLAEMQLAGLAMVLLGMGQFVSGHPYQEYQALALPPAAVLAGLAWGEVRRRCREPEMTDALLLVLVAVFPLLAIGPSLAALPGQKLGPLGIHGPLRRAAAVVAEHCPPGQSVFSFQTDVAVEAHRRLAPGLTLASFSLADLPDAARWHLVSPETIRATFAAAEPAVVVLSPGDLQNLLHGCFVADDRIAPTGDGLDRYGPLVAALDRNYRLVARVERYGQFDETLSILARREEP